MQFFVFRLDKQVFIEKVSGFLNLFKVQLLLLKILQLGTLKDLLNAGRNEQRDVNISQKDINADLKHGHKFVFLDIVRRDNN